MTTIHSYQVVHTTTYDYDAPVHESHGRAYLRPREEADQRVVSHTVTVTPEPAELHAHEDYWGNRSSYFRVDTAHRELVVTASSHVEVTREPPTWEALDGTAVGEVQEIEDEIDLEARELVLPSPMIPALEEVTAYAEGFLVPGRPLGQALNALLSGIHRDFAYTPGATDISTPLVKVMEHRKGVCQDFAHLMIGCLRAAGLPARYVSGYLLTSPPPGKPRLVGADASHAWISVLVPGRGWIDLDPTNDTAADHRYVVVARGRDYGDVPPLKGIIFTKSKKSTMTVSVDVEPITTALF